MSSKVYFSGVPTSIEINRLREVYKKEDLVPGVVIPYEDVEDIIGCLKNTYRYKTITQRWRHLIEMEYGVLIGVERCIGFKILHDNEKVDASSAKFRSAINATYRSLKIASIVNVRELTEEKRTQFDHNNKKATSMLQSQRLKPKFDLPII